MMMSIAMNDRAEVELAPEHGRHDLPAEGEEGVAEVVQGREGLAVSGDVGELGHWDHIMHIVPALALLTKIKIMYFKCKLFTCLSSASVLSSSTLPCHLNVPGHREGGLDCMPATIIREKSRNQERRN